MFHTNAQVNGIVHGSIGQEALEAAFNDDMVSNMCVLLLRLIVSAEIQRREDWFLPFILVRGLLCQVELLAALAALCCLVLRPPHGVVGLLGHCLVLRPPHGVVGLVATAWL